MFAVHTSVHLCSLILNLFHTRFHYNVMFSNPLDNPIYHSCERSLLTTKSPTFLFFHLSLVKPNQQVRTAAILSTGGVGSP